MAKPNQMAKLTVHFSSEGELMKVRTILTYEATIRGLSLSQTCLEMLEEAANLDAYPPEVMDRLDEIKLEARKRAVAKSLRMSVSSAESDFDDAEVDGPYED